MTLDPEKMVEEMGVALGVEMSEDLRGASAYDRWQYLLGRAAGKAFFARSPGARGELLEELLEAARRVAYQTAPRVVLRRALEAWAGQS